MFNYLICGLDRSICNNVEQAFSSHEMWKMLEVTHNDTNSMKETKINILERQYDLFKMSRYETIT